MKNKNWNVWTDRNVEFMPSYLVQVLLWVFNSRDVTIESIFWHTHFRLVRHCRSTYRRNRSKGWWKFSEQSSKQFLLTDHNFMYCNIKCFVTIEICWMDKILKRYFKNHILLTEVRYIFFRLLNKPMRNPKEFNCAV